MYPSDFSAIKFELFNDIIDAYQSMGGDKEGMLELKVYGLESLIHYTLDTYDLEDELYFIAKEMLDSIIDGVSKSEAKQKYISRLLELKEYVKHSERYHDRLVMEPGASCVV